MQTGRKVIKILTNDPHKNCSIFYCFTAIRFPMLKRLFSDEELINCRKAGPKVKQPKPLTNANLKLTLGLNT